MHCSSCGAVIAEPMRRLPEEIEVLLRVFHGRSPATEADPHGVGFVAEGINQVRFALHEAVPARSAAPRSTNLDFFLRGALPDPLHLECDLEPTKPRGLVRLDVRDLAREDRMR
jgi:hypothetical protein